jgi:hypothetical protein
MMTINFDTTTNNYEVIYVIKTVLYMMGQHELSQNPRVRLRGGTTLDTIT